MTCNTSYNTCTRLQHLLQLLYKVATPLTTPVQGCNTSYNSPYNFYARWQHLLQHSLQLVAIFSSATPITTLVVAVMLQGLLENAQLEQLYQLVCKVATPITTLVVAVMLQGLLKNTQLEQLYHLKVLIML